MRKITKSQRINQIADQLARQQGVISKLTIAVKEQNEAILMLEKLTDEKLRDQPEPQLKQLDQSVFNGLDEKWRFAAVDQNAETNLFEEKPVISSCGNYWVNASGAFKRSVLHFDNSNWQDSLIERDIAKELTGSDLCRAMLKRGDKIVTCAVKNYEDELDSYDAIIAVSSNGKYYESTSNLWSFAVPINNQGEPLTAAEAGL